MAGRVAGRGDHPHAARQIEARAILKLLVDGRGLESLGHGAQLRALRQHLGPRKPRWLAAIDIWRLNRVRQHARAAGLHQIVQRADMVDILVGQDDPL